MMKRTCLLAAGFLLLFCLGSVTPKKLSAAKMDKILDSMKDRLSPADQRKISKEVLGLRGDDVQKYLRQSAHVTEAKIAAGQHLELEQRRSLAMRRDISADTPKIAVPFDEEMMPPRIFEGDEQSLTADISRMVAEFRKGMKTDTHLNGVTGLNMMAMSVSLFASSAGTFSNFPDLDCFKRKIACELDFGEQLTNPDRTPEIINAFPNYCSRAFSIVGISGRSQSELRQGIRENMKVIGKEYSSTISVACTRSLGATPLGLADPSAIYYCAILVVHVDPSYECECLCLHEPYNCCPEEMRFSPVYPHSLKLARSRPNSLYREKVVPVLLDIGEP
eukprot:TRINITY_DN17904_c0_g1_i1.p1 TRINITY_DN17904_c0_g1~~TRINITY_DN17904_c0_g1_i1.p1  ORF type:complete len:334 (+),score=36.08 TRINITY_DN17904_c0_g1_i1:39-1040(+)